MNTIVSSVMEPLIRRKVFATEEEAVRSLLREFILRQINGLQRELTRFERKYGMRFEQFVEYLHERSVLLQDGELPPEQGQVLGRAVMQEEDDWLDWKVAREMLESWLGLRQEVIG
ncbi:MAG: hypothetical protein ABIK79_02990 [Chloroflexota bacterium]|nr:hypothetical protein [Anaerolineae bacterium]